jgi:hypothetical protein
MAKNLDGDMRQGPTMYACPLGFIQQIITINAREIKLQPFIQKVLQKFTDIYGNSVPNCFDSWTQKEHKHSHLPSLIC